MGILSDLLEPDVDTPAAPVLTDETGHANAYECPACKSRRGWIDRYKNPPHCATCSPPPVLSLISDLIGDWPPENFERIRGKHAGTQQRPKSQPKQPKPPTAPLDARESDPRSTSTSIDLRPYVAFRYANGDVLMGFDNEKPEVIEGVRFHLALGRELARELDMADRWDQWRARGCTPRRYKKSVTTEETIEGEATP